MYDVIINTESVAENFSEKDGTWGYEVFENDPNF